MRTFDCKQYQPMLRLLEEEDLVFLESQPGYRPEVGRHLRRARRRVLRMYLHSLGSDFHRLHAQARRMVAVAEAQHSELVGLLIRQKMEFWRARTILEFRLTLHWLNLGTVDLRPLLELLQQMQAQLEPPKMAAAG